MLDIPRIGGTPATTGSTAALDPVPVDAGRRSGRARSCSTSGGSPRSRRRRTPQVAVAAHAADAVRLDVELGVERGVLRGQRRTLDPARGRGRLPARAGPPRLRAGGRQVGAPLADRADARGGRPDPLRHRAHPGARRARRARRWCSPRRSARPSRRSTRRTRRRAAADLPAIARGARARRGERPASRRGGGAAARAGAADPRHRRRCCAPICSSPRRSRVARAGAGVDVPAGGGFLPNVPNWDAGLDSHLAALRSDGERPRARLARPPRRSAGTRSI